MSYKPYYTNGWKSGEAGGTPITPEALNHMEAGIEAAGAHADSTSNPHQVTAAQVGARPNTWTPTAKDVGALRNLGNNVINNINNDTTAKWAVVDSGYSFYTTNGLLNSQPSQWGILLHFKQDSDIFQIWNAQAGGPTYFRSGNNSGWNGSWRKAYDTANKPTASDVGAAASSHNHAAGNITSGTLALARGGTGSSGTSVSSASNSHFAAHFAKFGNLVVCTLLPKASADTMIYESSLTIPSGYRPSGQRDFTMYSYKNKNNGGDGTVYVQAYQGGSLKASDAYGLTIGEACNTYSWIAG